MIKKEVLEIRKQFTQDNCAISRICGCYVDAEKNIKTELKDAFLSLPEEEMFKYFEIFRKTLSGTVGKNLLNLEFPLEQESDGGTQSYLLKLRDSQLKDDDLLDDFYEKIIETYSYGENYYIILIHAAYDIPKRGKDNEEMFDASEDVYEYLLCCICPVKLSKAGLCYNEATNNIEDRIRDWIVEAPDCGFLFPAFNDRNTDLHSMLYYSKKADELQYDLIDRFFGCTIPLTARDQKDTFNEILEEALGEKCDYETVRTIHDTLNDMLEEHKDDPEPVTLDKAEVRRLLLDGGAQGEPLERFDGHFDETVGEKESLLASNLVNTRSFEIKTLDVVIKVNPDRTDLVETKTIDGRTYLVIEVNDSVEVNGIHVRTSAADTLAADEAAASEE